MKQWQLTWGDVTFTASDVTVADLAAVDALTGCGWECDPTSGPNVAANLIAVVAARLTGRPATDVIVEVGTAPAFALTAALDVVEEPATVT